MGDRKLNVEEQAILAAASTIFSGLASSSVMSKQNHEKAFNYSLKTAVAMATAIDNTFKSRDKTEIQSLLSSEVPFPLNELLSGEVPFPW